MSLNRLPDELVLLIAHNLSPPCVVQFSYCCRRFYRCLSSILVNFREKSQNLWVQHDRHPLTLLQLVRTAISGDWDAWFLRRLELWGTRRSWSDWKALRQFDPMNPIAFFQEQDPGDWSHLRTSAFTEAELDQYRNILINQLHMPPAQAQRLDGLFNGSDCILRIILVALSPNISELVLPNTSGGIYGDRLQIYWRTFDLLRHVPYENWPIGFRSLTTLKLNQELPHPNYLWSPNILPVRPAREVFNALLLPNLRHLHLCDVTFDPNHEGRIRANVEQISDRSLPLTSLVLTDANIYPWESYFLVQLVLKIQALKHIDVRTTRRPFTRPEKEIFESRRTFLSHLIHHHGTTLENVKVGSEEMLDIDLIPQFTRLKYAVLDVVMAQYGTCYPRRCWHHFETLLPPSLEFLHITQLDIRDRQIPKAMSALLSLAKKRGAASGRQPAALTDVCIKFIPPVQSDTVYKKDPLASYHEYLSQHRDSEFIRTTDIRSKDHMERFHKQWAQVLSRCEAYGVKVHLSFAQAQCPFPDRHIYDYNVLRQQPLYTMPEWRVRRP